MKYTKKEIIILIITIIPLILLITALLLFLNNRKNNINNDTKNTDIQNSNNKMYQEVDTTIIEPKGNYNNPVVPEGFKKVETDNASWNLDEQGNPKGWNDGLVIEDDKGNQFVWIPVKIAPQNITNKVYELPEGIKSEDIQIKKYGGFYVSRYEAGVSEEMQKVNNNINEETNNIKGIPVSKKNVRPWNYISYDNAKLNSESMYSNEYIQSGLLTKSQWYSIIYFLHKENESIKTLEQLQTDSTNIGNYLNSNFNFTGKYSDDDGKNYNNVTNMNKSKDKGIILSTGITDRNKTCNIYDLAGNMSEIISADLQNIIYVVGGSYLNDGLTPLENISSIAVKPSSKLGFRVVLYIK